MSQTVTTTHQKVTPFLWFDNNVQEAAEFYVSIFKNSRVINSSPFITTFELDGQLFQGLNGGPQFKFTEAISLFVDCENQEEVDYFWNKFLENGGYDGQCAWLKDKYGLSWQIVPKKLPQLLQDPDRTKADRVMQAMLKMSKIIVADLEKAYNGE